MKKIITLAVFVLCLCAYGYGQQTVYGGDFESWKFDPTWNYYEPDSSMFSTLNKIDTIPLPPGVSAYPCDTAYAGARSVRLVTREISSIPVTIPGFIGTLKLLITSGTAILGIPYPYGNTLPIRFSGWYKSYPVSGDSTAAVVMLSKWNSTAVNPHRDTIAYNRLAFHGTVTNWTAFDTVVTYHVLSTIPDTLTLLLLSCAGFNASSLYGSVGQVGTMAMFDNVNLTGVNGLPLQIIPSVKVKLSPNPASRYLNIELGSSIENGFFEVYDTQAKFIRQHSINGNSGQISVSDLSAGTYFYKLTENGKLLNSGTFIIAK